MATGSILLSVPAGGVDATNPPGLLYENDQWNMLFNDTTDEICFWSFRMPVNYASAPILKVRYRMDVATSGNVQIRVAIKAVADTQDPATETYDTDNLSGAIAVPGTVETEDEISITLTNDDTVAAAESITIRMARDPDHANDTAANDMKVSSVTLEYTTT